MATLGDIQEVVVESADVLLSEVVVVESVAVGDVDVVVVADEQLQSVHVNDTEYTQMIGSRSICVDQGRRRCAISQGCHESANCGMPTSQQCYQAHEVCDAEDITEAVISRSLVNSTQCNSCAIRHTAFRVRCRSTDRDCMTS